MNNDLGKLYEERIPTIKPKNMVKEQEVVCEDISTILNSIRDNKKMGHSSGDYSSNKINALDDKGKKQLEMLSNIRKQDYNTSINYNIGDNISNNVNINYESNDNKAKNDFQKFMINKRETASSSRLQSLKTDNNKNLKVKFIVLYYLYYIFTYFYCFLLNLIFKDNIKKSVEEKLNEKLKALGDKSEFKLKLNNLKK